MKLIVIYVIPNIISLITVIILYKKLQPRWLQLFLYFFLLTFLESVGGYTYAYFMKQSNHFIENIYLVISFSFYFFLFYKTLETKKYKIIVMAFLTVFLLCAFLDLFFINGFYFFNTYSSSVGSILIILSCLIYFSHLFTSDRLLNYFRTPMFWISTGLLFFFTGSLVQNSLIRYFISNKIDPGGRIYYFIMVTLNILLHTAFIISFLCNQIWKKARY
ncbi:MAG TPA: hypothetical protein VMY77_06980 [Chitinophagaceae bacterium]|nr:hypothetical protein [Chitinophagaceae bacterium]